MSGSLNIIESGVDLSGTYDFPLMIQSNYGSVYLVPFPRYTAISVEKCNLYTSAFNLLLKV